MTKKMEQKIQAVLEYNKKESCYYTKDGNVFFDENKAKFHAKEIGGKVEKYVLKPKKPGENGSKD